MESTIKLKSIYELFEYHFYISSYQRGYRWSEQQVQDLLDDLYQFTKNRVSGSKEFYCLQPIIVKKHNWKLNNIETNGWEVIDGQQRLTTIRILLEYLVRKVLKEGETLESEYGKDVYTINYETRSNWWNAR